MKLFGMDFDFAALLLALTALTGVVWAIDRMLFYRRRLERAVARGETPHEPVLVDYARSFFPVILAVLVFRSFIAEPFRIPSGSMMPTLLVGDFILVNKFAYGLRLPAFNTKVIATGEPHRGDVIVFRYPPDPVQDYIKRVVGLPGDEVTVSADKVFINGKPIIQDPVGPYAGEDAEGQMLERVGAVVRVEHLDGVDHRIIAIPGLGESRDGTWRVPQNCYFAMGDNRDNSADSRFWGCVPEQNLVGKAFLIWFSWKGMNHGVDFGRIGTVVK